MLLIPPIDCWGYECDTMPGFHSVFKGILLLHVCICNCRPEEHQIHTVCIAEVTDDCELPDMGARQ